MKISRLVFAAMIFASIMMFSMVSSENQQLLPVQIHSPFISGKVHSYEFAKGILGDDLITPEEIEKTYRQLSLRYSEAQYQRLMNTLPPIKTLHWCRANGYAVIAGPPKPMAIIPQLRLFFGERLSVPSKIDKFGNEYAIPSLENDKVMPGWLVIKKEFFPNSLNKQWDKQIQLLSENEAVPNAAEMSWFVVTFYKARGVRLLERVAVRTASVVPDGYHIIGGFIGELGGITKNEFSLCFASDNSSIPSVGLASIWKLPIPRS